MHVPPARFVLSRWNRILRSWCKLLGLGRRESDEVARWRGDAAARAGVTVDSYH